MRIRHSGRGGERAGFALIVVLLVLLALLVLCAPFLLTARNADRSSSELADRVDTRLVLDAARRHAKLKLADSHPSLDRTPYSDSEDELHVDEHFPEGFLRADDEHGAMWRGAATDVSGKIDLDSAPPQLFANLFGLSTRLVRPIKPDDKELPATSVQGFEQAGMLWCDGELIHYGKLGEAGFENFTRGIASAGEPWLGGPRPPSTHPAGAPLLDQRAFAVPLWRAAGPEGGFRELDSIAGLVACGDFALARATATTPEQKEQLWGGDLLVPLFAHGSVYGRAREAQRWMRPLRLVGPVTGGKDGRVRVESTRWVAPGSTLQVYDGQSLETAIVTEVSREGYVYLDRILVNDYRAWQAEVRVLARRPVNLNTAEQPVLEALFRNLQVRGKNSRINNDEARTLAEVVIESRPLLGWEDFLLRVVLPSCGMAKLPADAPVVPKALVAGQGFLDELDALALYRNGLNANDGELVYSTLPFCFRSSDVYELELRATVNAESGVERFTLVRDEVLVVAPQRRLMQLWATQEDYDEELRLSGAAPFWSTAPNATSMHDPLGSNPPTRLVAHWGTYGGKLLLPATMAAQANAPEDLPGSAEHVFASRGSNSWIQLWPARVEETARKVGRMIHFDHETHDPEGRYLPDEPVRRAANDKLVGWVDAPAAGASSTVGALMLPAAGSFWLKPRAQADSCLLDLAGGTVETDRLSIFFENGELVLRVYDGTGDHSGTPEREAGEARYAFAPGQDAPGLPIDVWSHVAFDVRGTRPDQISLLVNGKSHGVRRFGMSRLAAAIDMSTTQIRLESVVGFPARGVVRIGDELIEYTLGTNNTLDATPIVSGRYAGFGGRLARERTLIVNNTRVPEIISGGGGANGQIPANVGNHPAGTTVEVFGFSMPLRSDAPSGSSRLPAALGAFTVGIVSRAVTQNPSALGEQIPVVIPGVGTFNFGFGMEGNPSTVTALELKPADPQTSQTQLMAGFQPGGGWALLVQRSFGNLTLNPPAGSQNPPQTYNDLRTQHGVHVGGMEFVWYTGLQGNQLLLDMNKRGNATGFRIPGVAGREQCAFIVNWNDNITVNNVDPDSLLDYEVFVVPISIPVPGGSSHFLDPLASTPAGSPVRISEYAQITETQQAELTEWVRYDEVNNEQLVRNEDEALKQAFLALVHQVLGNRDSGEAPTTGGGGGTPGGGPGGPGGGPGPVGGGGGGALANLAQPPAPAAQQPTTGSYWSEVVGAPEASEGPITRAVSSALQFRGVFGTYSHPHAVNTAVQPVVRVLHHGGASPDSGRPGVDDPVFFVEKSPQMLGNPALVQRAYQPLVYMAYGWTQTAPDQMVPTANGGGVAVFAGGANPIDTECVYVGLRDALPVPYPFDPIAAGNTGGATVVPDIRERYRMTKHPSGERPRVVNELSIGGSLVQSPSGVVPSALVDELCFGGAVFARNSPGVASPSGQGAQLWLTTELAETGTDFIVAPKAVRMPDDLHGGNYEFLTELPDDAGLLQLGEEILCYNSRTTNSGQIRIASGGRGLLGTRTQPHHAHESAEFLEDFVVSVLDGALSATASEIQLTNTQDFPGEGLVLIEDELIHYTHLEGNALAMPRASSVPGKQDRKGGPLFRGRFGTVPAAHASGTPVILFPFRYWDRWADRADAPELAHFDLGLDQPSAWWESCFFMKTDVEGAQIGVLERHDPEAPWDADPDTDQRLVLRWKGDQEGKPHDIGLQSDGLRWRVFVKYAPDAFDPKASMRHGWRQTPRLERLGAFYYAPDALLRSVER